MASYPAKKNAAFVFYVGLISQADTKILQANPTLAAGDVKVAIDDGAPNNLATLPVVDADFTKRVKVSLSAAEMNGDNITIIFSDAAGAEWCDLIINIQTVTRQIDDLAFPNTSGRGIDVDATGGVEVTPNQAVNVAQWLGVEPLALSSQKVQAVDSAAAQASVCTEARLAELDAANLPTDVANVQTDTNDIQSRLPAALVGGRMASNAEVVGDKTGYAIGAGGIAAAAFVANAIDAAALATDAANEIRDAIKALVVESQGSYTLQQALSIILSVLAGVTADSGATLKSPNGVATRVAATLNASNERTAMTLTPSS